MIIDFHTHVWPDKIATNTVKHLENWGKIKAFSDGTVDNLKKAMSKSNINKSVILPVMTKVTQFETINSCAALLDEDDMLISFGAIHPDCDKIKEKLLHIKSLGLKGIKIHPDYQGHYINDSQYIKIIDQALNHGLIVVSHVGRDVAYPGLVRGTPDRVLSLLMELGISKNNAMVNLVLAHAGGLEMWDLVEEYLVGMPIYFDLSLVFKYIKTNQLLNIIKGHTADRILFGTDTPWSDQGKMIDAFNTLDLTYSEKDKILYRNAQTLLRI